MGELATAALLAKHAGKRLLVLERHYMPGGSSNVGGQNSHQKGLYLAGQDIVTSGVTAALVSGFLSASAVLGKNLMGAALKR